MDCQITRGGGAVGWKRGGSDGETMVSAKCSPSPSPSSVVVPDDDNYNPTPSREEMIGFNTDQEMSQLSKFRWNV